MRNIKIGMIILKDKIINIKITKNILFITIQNKILVFELRDLKYITTIDDVDTTKIENKHSISTFANPIVVAHTSWSNPDMIKINKCKYI
jgi:hypothetical protein